MIKIFHVNVGTAIGENLVNWGDVMLVKGIHNLIEEHLGIYSNDIISDPTIPLTPKTVDDIINKYDLFLLGGGGYISYSEFLNSSDFLDHLNIPSVVYAIGFNPFRTPHIPNPQLSPKVRKQLNDLNSKATFFSVRNDESLEKLQSLSFSPKDKESPDPGFWAWDRKIPLERLYDYPYVIINTAGDSLPHRYQYNGISHMDFYFRLKLVVDYLLAKNYRIFFSQHIKQDAFCFTYLKWRPDIVSVLDHEEMHKNGLKWYKHADFIIGMRGHAQIVPIGLKTPTISWSSQDKNNGTMKKLNLEHWNIDVSEPRFEIFVQKTEDLICEIENNRSALLSQYDTILVDLKKRADNDFKTIKERLGW